jgi:hypothetical protein
MGRRGTAEVLGIASSLLKNPPGEGTGPTSPSKHGAFLVGRVPSRDDRGFFNRLLRAVTFCHGSPVAGAVLHLVDPPAPIMRNDRANFPLCPQKYKLISLVSIPKFCF